MVKVLWEKYQTIKTITSIYHCQTNKFTYLFLCYLSNLAGMLNPDDKKELIPENNHIKKPHDERKGKKKNLI